MATLSWQLGEYSNAENTSFLVSTAISFPVCTANKDTTRGTNNKASPQNLNFLSVQLLGQIMPVNYLESVFS